MGASRVGRSGVGMSRVLSKGSTFSDYVKTYDPGKMSWLPLWERGSVIMRPSTVTFDPNAASRPGAREGNGVWVTTSTHTEIALVKVELPTPHNNGIHFETFGELQASACIKAVEKQHPWLNLTRGRKAKAIESAMKSPGTTVLYDAHNGYWRSSIWPLVRDFLILKNTGVDPRPGRPPRPPRSNKKKRGREPATAVVSQEEEEHVYEEKEDTNEPIPLGQSVSIEKAPAASTAPATAAPATNVIVHAVGVPVGQRPKRAVRAKDWLMVLDVHQQSILYCGHIQDLWKYLKQRGLHKYNRPATWRAIREWTYTESGRKWLSYADMKPEYITLDHIHARGRGRIDHPFNCFLMPIAANSHFKDNWTEEKEKYVGELAARTSSRFVKWYIDEAGKLDIDCSKFTAVGL